MATSEYGCYQAKTHLPKLLKRVSKGEKITITRHGLPIAYVVPAKTKSRNTEEVIRELKTFRQKHSLNGLQLKQLIEQGRR